MNEGTECLVTDTITIKGKVIFFGKMYGRVKRIT